MKKIIFAILLSMASFTFNQSSFAETDSGGNGSPVTVINFDDIMNKISSLFFKLYIATDSWFQNLISPSAGTEKAGLVSDNLKVSLDQFINLDLSDDLTKEQNDLILASLNAGDDNPTVSYLTSESTRQKFLNTTISSIYSSDPNAAKKARETNQSNNALFNAAMFLDTLKYDTSGNPSGQDLATKYLRYLVNLVPSPTVITLGPVFAVPWSADSTQSMTTIDLSDANSKIAKLNRADNKGRTLWNINNLKNNLLSDPDYRDYRLNYRVQVAVRSLFLNNILNAYQNRMIVTDDKKSLAEVEHDQVYRYLNKGYIDKINDSASPITIQRETLFLLAEINRQIYEMRQMQERTLIVQSIGGLQSLSVNKASALSTNQKIAQKIYCTVYGDIDTKNCGQAGGVAGGAGAALQQASGG